MTRWASTKPRRDKKMSDRSEAKCPNHQRQSTELIRRKSLDDRRFVYAPIKQDVPDSGQPAASS